MDLKSALEPLQADLPPGAVTAFHARELPGYAMADNVRAAWDIDRIRDEHLSFIETWSDPASSAEAGTALSTQTMLVADWLELLRADPRLPRTFMGDDWPADRSFEVYWTCRRALEEAADAQFAALAGVSPRSAPEDRPSAPSPMPSAAARRR